MSQLRERSTPGRPVRLIDGQIVWEREDDETRLMEKHKLTESALPRTYKHSRSDPLYPVFSLEPPLGLYHAPTYLTLALNLLNSLARRSTMEMHYYHVMEVWHCLYERAEMRHLR